ncbi:type VI secretion system protein TssA [Pseudoxanthomonas putridarboris]|uniref:Type VI secretion system protein TssA n=1 Tax=Pseudoxanthomonas putridarboris TaxID=752605 RepID=A0ABU9J547_9GAMM
MSDIERDLLAPISKEVPEGRFDDEDELYLEVEMQMVKLGGMQAGTLDWTLVEDASRRYLREQCKHFRVVGHLGSAWLRNREWEGWIQSLRLIAGMVDAYWLNAYPRTGADGMTAKRKQLAAFGDRLSQSLKQLPSDGHSDDIQARANAAIDALERAERRHGIVPSLADRLRPGLKLAGDAAKRAPYEPPRPAGPSPQQHGGQMVGSEFFTTRSESPLGNERETRALYLKLAEFINQQDAYEPTGYLLRRHALWSGIHATPPIKREQRTEMMSVPVNISTEYQEVVAAGAISPALLLRIEKSVASSPYWLRGSLLAATVAQRLEMPMVALVIKTAVERFVRRLPTLRDLCFSDGSRFIDEDTFAWLSGASDSSAASPASAALAAMQGELAVQQKEGESVEAVLLQLQSRQGAGTSPRERHYASAAAADLLTARGLTWLAQDLYASVAHVMSEQTASQWEPELFNHVRAKSGQQPQ